MTVREFLKKAVLTREEVDIFLEPEKPNWAVFDSEVGYLLKSSLMKDGMNSCFTVSHYDPEGYNPLGNHFFAHSIRDGVIDWLDPKPLAYHQKGISSTELMSLLA